MPEMYSLTAGRYKGRGSDGRKYTVDISASGPGGSWAYRTTCGLELNIVDGHAMTFEVCHSLGTIITLLPPKANK